MAYLYQHKTIAALRVANFQFKNYILRIESDEENQRWLDLYRQLPRNIGGGLIVGLKAESNEIDLSKIAPHLQGPKTTRGAASTSFIPDGVRNNPAQGGDSVSPAKAESPTSEPAAAAKPEPPQQVNLSAFLSRQQGPATNA